jgi:hypothetical protein
MEAGGLRVQSQPGIYSETLSQKRRGGVEGKARKRQYQKIFSPLDFWKNVGASSRSGLQHSEHSTVVGTSGFEYTAGAGTRGQV